MTRPDLNPVDLAAVWPPGTSAGIFVTMSAGQWDQALSDFYEGGAVLIEMGADGPIAAYKWTGAAVAAPAIVFDHTSAREKTAPAKPQGQGRNVTFIRDAEGRIAGFEETNHGR